MTEKLKCKVKICGITSIHDACLAADAGANYIGILVDVAASERTMQITQAVEIASGSPIPTVLLLYNRTTSDIQDGQYPKYNPTQYNFLDRKHHNRLKNSNGMPHVNSGNLSTYLQAAQKMLTNQQYMHRCKRTRTLARIISYLIQLT